MAVNSVVTITDAFRWVTDAVSSKAALSQLELLVPVYALVVRPSGLAVANTRIERILEKEEIPHNFINNLIADCDASCRDARQRHGLLLAGANAVLQLLDDCETSTEPAIISSLVEALTHMKKIGIRHFDIDYAAKLVDKSRDELLSVRTTPTAVLLARLAPSTVISACLLSLTSDLPQQLAGDIGSLMSWAVSNPEGTSPRTGRRPPFS